MSRVLGVWEITLLGIAALLGGGVFTLLGHSAGFAGGGLVLSMLIGAVISFINLNAYISLATAFPDAGGGYNWVRDGLGEMQGFFAGWFSWMAHSVACALYAVSFGIFASEFAFSLLQMPLFGLAPNTWGLIFTACVILIFGIVNYRGTALTGRIGGYISVVLLTILGFYIIFGFKNIIDAPELFANNFSPFLPFGMAGVLQATAFFYIAFEGSEIQAQSGEEAKNPERTLKISLFSSWAIISVLYLLIAIVIIGVVPKGSGQSWEILNQLGGRAIIHSAQTVMPLGYVLMIVGGLLANIAALNATIYSASRVLFAMARDKFVLERLGIVHTINQIPHYALIVSIGAILITALFLPLHDIAAGATILFILLFMQLNIAYIQLRRKKPEAIWHYIVPGGAFVPVLGITAYVLLSIALFDVSQFAIYFALIWFLLGLVNYYGYTLTEKREDLERDTIYEHASRFKDRSNYKVIFPIEDKEKLLGLSAIACALAKNENGDILAIHVREVPHMLPLREGIQNSDHAALDRMEGIASQKHFNIDTRLLVARSIPESILDTVSVENGDLLIMGWDGVASSHGFIFGRKVDIVLHRAKCDLVVVSLPYLHSLKKIFIPVPTDDNPNLRFTGKIATALALWFDSEITIGMVIPPQSTHSAMKRYEEIMKEHIRELKLKTPKELKTKFIESVSISRALIEEMAHHDSIIFPAARARISKIIGFGTIPERVAKHCHKTVILAKGYRSIIQPLLNYLISKLY